MRFNTRILLVSATMMVSPQLALATSSVPPAAPVAAVAGAPLTRADVEKIIEERLMEKPEIIVNAIGKYQEKQQEEAKAKAKEAVSKYKTELTNDPATPSVGPKDADAVMVEFFDYHCGYCKHMLPVVSQLLKEDPKLRVVFKEYPILSEDSTLAAKGGLAVWRLKPEKYFDYHAALMNEKGKFDEKSLVAVAKKLGVDETKFKAELKNPELDAIIEKDRVMANELNIRGTPGFVIGDEIIPGAASAEDLKAAIARARSPQPAAAPAAAAPTAAPAPAAPVQVAPVPAPAAN